ncbi:hypothetical protein BDK51DRAFT_46739 [Blyttiomyces helicus]|uniref:Uncharacterized protein n=1 Tax=Blyttiomyces helicus TaxID=388810 RepID=A0A4P9W8W0_9FUNG|nr:hypothetical protein BDK51DRAFT_46739 [Blyttiomyces helicus]|eukprot:RKO86616.1 hypothetical protein BDK51DRAFT_46739 [Blyttiomyces helicus]
MQILEAHQRKPSASPDYFQEAMGKTISVGVSGYRVPRPVHHLIDRQRRHSPDQMQISAPLACPYPPPLCRPVTHSLRIRMKSDDEEDEASPIVFKRRIFGKENREICTQTSQLAPPPTPESRSPCFNRPDCSTIRCTTMHISALCLPSIPYIPVRTDGPLLVCCGRGRGHAPIAIPNPALDPAAGAAKRVLDSEVGHPRHALPAASVQFAEVKTTVPVGLLVLEVIVGAVEPVGVLTPVDMIPQGVKEVIKRIKPPVMGGIFTVDEDMGGIREMEIGRVVPPFLRAELLRAPDTLAPQQVPPIPYGGPLHGRMISVLPYSQVNSIASNLVHANSSSPRGCDEVQNIQCREEFYQSWHVGPHTLRSRRTPATQVIKKDGQLRRGRGRRLNLGEEVTG